MTVVYPVLGRVAGVLVYSFAAAVGVAVLVAGTAAVAGLRREGVRAGPALVVVLAAIAGGFAGARGWWLVGAHGVDPRTWPGLAGGLVWWGGVLGGTLGASAVLAACGAGVVRGADALAPAVALGLALGRIGCHLAGDGDWGTPTLLPWGVSYADGVAGWPHPLDVRVHPAPLYESVASFATWSWLRALARARPRPGAVTAWWAVLAGTSRALVEAVRTNPPVALGLTAAQLAGLGVAVAGGVALMRWSWSCRRT